MQILIEIDEAKRPGIAYARALFNAERPGTVEVEGEQVPNPELLASDEGYIALVIARAVDSYNANLPAAPAPPAPPPGAVNGVPQVVTRRQGRQALIQTDRLHLVQPALDAIPDPLQRAMMQSEWDDSQEFLRQRPSLLAIGAAIGLDAAALDALFILAATL